MVKENPLVLPAVILAVILYTGLLRVNCETPYCSLVPQKSVSSICGTVVSTPMRVEGRKTLYRIKLKLNSVYAKNGACADASGVVEAFVPPSLYEIYSPGKLYSAWRGQKEEFLIDSGAEVQFDVAAQKNGFSVVAIKRCDWQNGRSVWLRLKKIRALCRLHFTRLMYAWGSAGGLVLALLSGSREYLQSEVRDAFKNAGLSHILALSGMHLSLFSGMAFFLGKKSVGKKFARVFQLVAILAFFWFAGRSPSLFRALLCSLCMIGCAAFHLKINSMLNILAFSFLVHIAIFPADMFELAFMFSYGALAGILCFNEFIAKPLSRALPFTAGNSLGQSAGAQFFTAPISMRFFSILTPGGIIASAVVSPMVTVFVYMALAFIALCLVFPVFAPICGKILGVVYSVLSQMVLWFAKIPQIKF